MGSALQSVPHAIGASLRKGPASERTDRVLERATAPAGRAAQQHHRAFNASGLALVAPKNRTRPHLSRFGVACIARRVTLGSSWPAQRTQVDKREGVHASVVTPRRPEGSGLTFRSTVSRTERRTAVNGYSACESGCMQSDLMNKDKKTGWQPEPRRGREAGRRSLLDGGPWQWATEPSSPCISHGLRPTTRGVAGPRLAASRACSSECGGVVAVGLRVATQRGFVSH